MADFFDTAKFPGKRGIIKRPKYALEFALLGDGAAPMVSDLARAVRLSRAVQVATAIMAVVLSVAVRSGRRASPPS